MQIYRRGAVAVSLMLRPISDAFWLTLPVLFGLGVLLLAIFIKGGRPLIAPMSLISTYLIGYDVGGWFQHIPRCIVRAILLVLMLLCFYYPEIRDYSPFFPRHFDIIVHFDEPGIRGALAQFPEERLFQLNLASDWPLRRIDYFRQLNDELKTVNPPFSFDVENNNTFGSGVGVLDLRMLTDRWQTYQIANASGRLTIQTSIPGTTTSERLQTEYLLSPVANILIHASISDIYLRWGAVTEIEFWEMVRRTPTEQPIRYSTLVALTKVNMLPIVNFGQTVYLAKVGAYYVPVGYAIYTPSVD